MEKQKREFDDQLKFYESLKSSSNDKYWHEKREMLEQEMIQRTADIHDNNLNLKSTNADLLLNLRSKTEELAKVNKKWQDKCQQSLKNETMINGLESEKIRLTNENQRMNGKLQQEDIKFKAAIQQRDEAFEQI